MRAIVLTLLAGVALSGCGVVSLGAQSPSSTPSASVDASPSTEPPPSSSPTATPTPTPSPPIAPARYEPAANEVYPNAKKLAADVAYDLTNYGPDDDPRTIASAVAGGPEQAASLVEAARPLLHPGRWSRGAVVYPQLGGVTPSRVSVMVVVEQRTGVGGETQSTVSRTLDVRLVLRGDAWVFDELASAGGVELPRPSDLPPEATAVLDDPRIELPDSARWDIYAGGTSTALLRLMSELAERTPYGVVVLSSGHPFNVFGSEHQSNHTKGRAVDIYRVGSVLVIDDRDPGSATDAEVRGLYEHPALSEIGSPWALDGFGGRSFTDVVHQDHLHIGVKAGAA